MAGRVKNWWNSLWDDDDTVYEDESSFDDDIWADLGIDPGSDPDTWTDPITPTDDPYGIGSLFDFDPASNVFDPDPTPNIFDAYNADNTNWADTYDFGDWGAPPVDFEDPDFNWGEFDVDAYLDSILDPDYGGGTEGDPSDWFMNTGDPATQDYSGVGGGMPSTFDTSLLDELGYDPSTGSVEDWLQSFLPTTEVDQWEDLRDEFGNIDPSLFTGPRSRGPLGGGIGPWLRDLFLGKGGLGGKKEGEGIGGILGLLGGLFGKANTAVGTIGGGIGSLLNSPLGQLAMLNYMRNKKESDIHVPIGYGDGGGGGGDGSPIDYRVFNIQPALMPGVAYANVGKPEGMRGGGLGDVTLAKLEPGEFVVTKKAVDNIGAQNLYKMMKQWEGRG